MTAAGPARALRRGAMRRWWGAGPLHLVGHVALLLVAAYALSVMFEQRFAPRPWNLVLWLLGGAILHDLVFLPAYSALDVAAARLAARGARGVAVLNHLRVPAVLSGVLLLVFSPRIFDGQPQNFERALGHPAPDYLARWLAVTVGLFALSALVYAVRWLSAGRASPDRRAAASGADAGQ